MGADREGRDVKEAGLEGVGGGDGSGVVRGGLKREDRGKGGESGKEVLVGWVL